MSQQQTEPIVDPAIAVQAVLDESRNGLNEVYRHALVRRFNYSDGVRELAQVAGAYWLLDIIATEVVPVMQRLIRSPGGVGTSYIEMRVGDDAKAEITLTIADDAPPAWSRKVDFTDFPPGHWVLFEIGPSGDEEGIIAILPSEH